MSNITRAIKKARKAAISKHTAFMDNVIGNIIARWDILPEDERERCRLALMSEANEAQLERFLAGIGEL